MLVTETAGRLTVVTQAGVVGAPVTGLPAVAPAGQGGLPDVALDPAFASNSLVYLSYSESDFARAGLAVLRGRLQIAAEGPGSLNDVTVIWRQRPRIANDTRHYGGRITFAPDGMLMVTAGERHQGAPAQDQGTTPGKIIRIRPDGTIPADNPFVGVAGMLPEIRTLGHRNPYGLRRVQPDHARSELRLADRVTGQRRRGAAAPFHPSRFRGAAGELESPRSRRAG